jgi:polyhydroxyalkanoate synthesis regulator phasin
MTKFDDLRKSVEATVGNLSPAKAQQLAKSLVEPGARKEQVAKTAADLVEWSQRNRERFRTAIRREIADQMQQMGVATRVDLDALKKRVRDLERAAGMTASGRSAAQKTPAAPKPTAPKPAVPKPAVAKPTARKPATTPSPTVTTPTTPTTPTTSAAKRTSRGTGRATGRGTGAGPETAPGTTGV